MRLFIAIDIPPFEDFLIIQEKIKKITKCTIPKHFHITLKFLGNVEDNKLKDIIHRLNKISFNEFEIKTEHLGFFPSIKKINVVWLGIEKNQDLIKLNYQINNLLHEFKDTHEFKPHITLARTEHNPLLTDLLKIKLDSKKIKINSFKLYESILTSQGPIYKVMKEFKSN
ncbi:MAG: RNA 2',3'-cyclic phosphodiesterase [Candidatus Woesearchaeota archaeon]